MRASFVTLAAYDWRLLPTSIGAYHEAADEVLVGLDSDRLTWSGTPFDCDRAALELALAPFPKCRVMEGRFYDPGRRPIENDCYERERLAKHARNEWVVEVDADELVDGRAVVEALALVPDGHQLYGVWLDVLKVVGDIALVKDAGVAVGACALATRSRSRQHARQTGEPPLVMEHLQVEHLTTARPEAELRQKLAGWGHSQEVPPGFLERWRAMSSRTPGVRAVPAASLRWGQGLV